MMGFAGPETTHLDETHDMIRSYCRKEHFWPKLNRRTSAIRIVYDQTISSTT